MSFGNLGHSVAVLPPDEGSCPTGDVLTSGPPSCPHCLPHYTGQEGATGLFPGASPLHLSSSWWLLEGPALTVTLVFTWSHPLDPLTTFSVLPSSTAEPPLTLGLLMPSTVSLPALGEEGSPRTQVKDRVDQAFIWEVMTQEAWPRVQEVLFLAGGPGDLLSGRS